MRQSNLARSESPGERLRAASRADTYWVCMHDDRIAGRDSSLARLMRRMDRAGMPPAQCAFRLVASIH